MIKVNLILGLCICFALCSFAGEKPDKRADFLILKDLHSLEILNRYEQPLSVKEKHQFLPYAPVQVLEDEMELGDGISTAMEIRYEGQVYFLLSREKGQNSQSVLRYNDCQVLSKLELAASQKIPYSEGIQPGSRAGTLMPGDVVSPVFACQKYQYVKKMGANKAFVWCSKNARFQKDEVAPQAKETGMGENLKNSLSLHLGRVNETYKTYTQAFNQLTGESRNPPAWECTFAKESMQCSLKGDFSTQRLKKSTDVLVSELNHRLVGRPFRVTFVEQELMITPLNNKEEN